MEALTAAVSKLGSSWDQRQILRPSLKRWPQTDRPCYPTNTHSLLWPLRGSLSYGHAEADSWRFRNCSTKQAMFIANGEWMLRDSERTFSLLKIEWNIGSTLLTLNDDGHKSFLEFAAIDPWIIQHFEQIDDDLKLKSLLGLAISQMQRSAPARSKAERSFLACCEHIRGHLHEEVTRLDVANTLGMHPGHISRLFARFHDGGFDAWLKHERNQRAVQLLKDPELQIQEIAHLCGISNVSWFIRCFKQEMGVTPMQYRLKNVHI